MWQGLMGGTEALSVTSPNSLLQCITPNCVAGGHTNIHTHPSLHLLVSLPPSLPPSLPQDSRVATGTYKALCGIVHEAQLEALLVLKGLCQGVTQVVRGQGALPTVLELGENTLKRRRRT